MNKQRMKNILGKILCASGLYRYQWQNQAICLMFHSVNPNATNNNMACLPSEFDDICRFCSDHFHVTTFADLTTKIHQQQDISSHLLISFDDGYKDNVTLAAPILTKYRLPACFFVTTDFIESQHVAWWDEEVGIQSEWMKWHDVKQLQQHGFDIGSHSHTHADFGKINAQQARHELITSADKLEEQLGQRPSLFAYPYGGEKNIHPDNHQITKEFYPTCITAIGGTITHATPSHYLPRLAINAFDDYQYYNLAIELMRNRH